MTMLSRIRRPWRIGKIEISKILLLIPVCSALAWAIFGLIVMRDDARSATGWATLGFVIFATPILGQTIHETGHAVRARSLGSRIDRIHIGTKAWVQFSGKGPSSATIGAIALAGPLAELAFALATTAIAILGSGILPLALSLGLLLGASVSLWSVLLAALPFPRSDMTRMRQWKARPFPVPERGARAFRRIFQ